MSTIFSQMELETQIVHTNHYTHEELFLNIIRKTTKRRSYVVKEILKLKKRFTKKKEDGGNSV